MSQPRPNLTTRKGGTVHRPDPHHPRRPLCGTRSNKPLMLTRRSATCSKCRAKQ